MASRTAHATDTNIIDKTINNPPPAGLSELAAFPFAAVMSLALCTMLTMGNTLTPT